MRLFEAIKAERDEILRTVALLEDSTAGDPETRERLLEALRSSIAEQNRIDEAYIYPIFAVQERGRELVERSRREMATIERELEAVCQQPKDLSELKYRIGSLSGWVRIHMAHENEELLPEADRLLSDEEEEALGGLIAQRHEGISRRLRPH